MTEFDYIITGAGSAGCVLANRLSAGGRLSVLLVEAGGSDRSPWVRLPIGYGKTYTDPRFNWKYFTEPDPGLSGRRDYWPRGKVLGGSSSINAMVYVRGHPGDFDDWAAMGNPGWSYADVLPYFRKFEDHAWGASAYHGAGGPLAISDIRRDIHPLCEHFISSCVAVGIARNDDFNAEHLEGAGIWQLTIRRGLRESAATAFLRPAMKRSNLAVRTQAMVTRVLFDDRRARGIEYQHKGITISARARREVIVCAGAINSPQLLQLSGVGPAPLLRQHGINVVHDLPMVGQGLQDHIAVSYSYRSRVPTLNDELYPLSGKIRAGLRYLFARRGILGMSVNQAGAFASSRPGLARPNLQLYFNPLAYPSPTPEVRRLLRPHAYSGFVMSFNTCRPTSRGVIDIVSRDPYSPPAIKVNSLAKVLLQNSM